MNRFNSRLPETVDQVVEQLLSEITLNNEIQIALIKEDDLQDLHFSLAVQIRSQFRLWIGIEALMESCRSTSGNQNLHIDDASMVIIRALWERLKGNSILTDS